MKEWDEKEKNRSPLKKYKIKAGQLKEIVSDAIAFRFLLKKVYSKSHHLEFFISLQHICDQAIAFLDYPQTPEDKIIMEKFIFKKMKELYNWNVL